MTEENKVTTESQGKPRNRVPNNPYKKGDYKEFVRFYAMPSAYKRDKFGVGTETEFAKLKELSPETLTEWKKRPEFEKDIDDQLNKWGAGKTPDVIASLYRTILKDGKASEVKLWLQYIKRWKEGVIIESPPFDMASIAKAVREVNKEENAKRDNKSS